MGAGAGSPDAAQPDAARTDAPPGPPRTPSPLCSGRSIGKTARTCARSFWILPEKGGTSPNER